MTEQITVVPAGATGVIASHLRLARECLELSKEEAERLFRLIMVWTARQICFELGRNKPEIDDILRRVPERLHLGERDVEESLSLLERAQFGWSEKNPREIRANRDGQLALFCRVLGLPGEERRKFLSYYGFHAFGQAEEEEASEAETKVWWQRVYEERPGVPVEELYRFIGISGVRSGRVVAPQGTGRTVRHRTHRGKQEYDESDDGTVQSPTEEERLPRSSHIEMGHGTEGIPGMVKGSLLQGLEALRYKLNAGHDLISREAMLKLASSLLSDEVKMLPALVAPKASVLLPHHTRAAQKITLAPSDGDTPEYQVISVQLVSGDKSWLKILADVRNRETGTKRSFSGSVQWVLDQVACWLELPEPIAELREIAVRRHSLKFDASRSIGLRRAQIKTANVVRGLLGENEYSRPFAIGCAIEYLRRKAPGEKRLIELVGKD